MSESDGGPTPREGDGAGGRKHERGGTLRALLLCLALTAAPSPAAAAAQGLAVAADTGSARLEGRVANLEDGTPLAHAYVQLRAGGERTAILADGRGHYAIEGVPSGPALLRVTAMGHEPLEVEVDVPASGSLALDLALALRPLPLPALVASVSVEPAAPAEGPAAEIERQSGERQTQRAALEAGPGLAELASAARRPGEPGPDPDPSSVLYVRGAGSDLKLVLLDGAPVYAPFHLGGLMEAFQPGVLASSRLWVAGAPARYDGGLSYVLDLQVRPGRADRIRTAGSADLLGARIAAEGPVGPGSLLLAGRELHGGAVSGLAGGGDLPYGYREGLGRVDVPLGEETRISATGFYNRESVRLEGEAPVDGEARWGNAAGSVSLRGPVADGRLAVTAAAGRFETRLPGARGELPRLQGVTDRRRVAADYGRPIGEVELSFGLGVDVLRASIRGRDSVGAIPEATETRWMQRGESAGAYVEVEWPLVPEVTVRTGLRSDLFFPGGRMRVAPRGRVAWEPEAGTVLSLSAGRYEQHLRAPETILAADLEGASPGDLGVPSSDGLGSEADAPPQVAGATHLAVALEEALDPRLRLGLEGHFKLFDGVPGAGRLRTSGADLWVHRSGDDLSAWVGYSLAWVWMESMAPEGSDRFAGRQILTGGLDLGLWSGLEGSLRLAYGSGLPFTPVPATPAAEPLASDEDPDAPPTSELAAGEEEVPAPLPLAGAPEGSYLRLDATLRRSWPISVAGVEGRLTPYVRVLNALDRRDALFYHFDPDRDRRPSSLAALPLLPVVGVEWNL